ncbi:translation initiation factor eIF-1A [Halolamina litorea]|uniref:Translation initiation factor 1A n=1 Tax=Halolamina litorea TaxID=1515593 RepID=A0ABD6BUX7_9EURY|nr:translation initiation factor eIF-1A [Halolamina litorea]
MSDDDLPEGVRAPEDDEQFAEVVEMLGANRIKVRCADGQERTARIPGRMRKRDWIREGDLVLISPWDWQEEKADVEYRYDNRDAEQLREGGYVAEGV